MKGNTKEPMDNKISEDNTVGIGDDDAWCDDNGRENELEEKSTISTTNIQRCSNGDSVDSKNDDMTTMMTITVLSLPRLLTIYTKRQPLPPLVTLSSPSSITIPSPSQ